MPGRPSAPSRRSALIGGCAGLVGLVGTGLGAAACSRGGGGPAPSDPPAPAPDPDAGLRESARRAEEALIALHTATVVRHPGLGAALAPATGHHRVHLDTLSGTNPEPAPTGTGPATSTPPPGVPDDPAAALSAVREAEAAAAAERLLDCLSSTDPALASVLASVGAAEAAHAALLAGGA